jgi:hypothetical protein
MANLGENLGPIWPTVASAVESTILFYKMESLTCTRARIATRLEETKAHLERYRDMAEEPPTTPNEEEMVSALQQQRHEYRQSISEVHVTRAWLNGARARRIEALKRGDKRRTLAAIKECRKARAALSKRAQNAITNEYRVDATSQEINMSGVHSFMAAMAPIRIVDLEEEIKGLDQTLREIDTILARPKKKKTATDSATEVLESRTDPCVVDLTAEEELSE